MSCKLKNVVTFLNMNVVFFQPMSETISSLTSARLHCAAGFVFSRALHGVNVFSRSAPFACFCFEFLLAYRVVYACCDWPEVIIYISVAERCIVVTVQQVQRLWSTSIPVCVSTVTDPRRKEKQTCKALR